MLKSRRYIELAAPFMIIASSLVLGDVLRYTPLRVSIVAIQKSRLQRQAILTMVVSFLVALTIMPQFGFLSRIQQVRAEVMQGIPLERYQKGSLWLAANTLPETIVLHSDWDDWPMLFYYNRRNFYIVGLDPTFMYNYDEGLYQAWADFTAAGKVDDLVDLVDGRLHARFMMIEKDHTVMQQAVSSNASFQLIYEDAEVWVYRYVP
jgi:hypothetical protein